MLFITSVITVNLTYDTPSGGITTSCTAEQVWLSPAVTVILRMNDTTQVGIDTATSSILHEESLEMIST